MDRRAKPVVARRNCCNWLLPRPTQELSQLHSGVTRLADCPAGRRYARCGSTCGNRMPGGAYSGLPRTPTSVSRTDFWIEAIKRAAVFENHHSGMPPGRFPQRRPHTRPAREYAGTFGRTRRPRQNISPSALREPRASARETAACATPAKHSKPAARPEEAGTGPPADMRASGSHHLRSPGTTPRNQAIAASGEGDREHGDSDHRDLDATTRREKAMSGSA